MHAIARATGRRPLVILAAVAGLILFAHNAQAQVFPELWIEVSCEPPCVGLPVDCTIRVDNSSEYGDTMLIEEVWQEIETGTEPVRYPAIGGLPIEEVFGNAIALPDGTAFIGAPGSTFGGLPGVDAFGAVTFRSDGYTLQPDDPPFVSIRNWVRYTDQCDGSSGGCSSVPALKLKVRQVQHPCADTNADGIVDIVDLLTILVQWGECADCTADVALCDGVVGTEDLLAIVEGWGVCP